MFYVHFVVSTPLWIAIGLCIIGLAALFASSVIVADINKTSGQITHETKRLIGGRTAIYAVGAILRIETRKSWRMNDGRRTGNLSRSLECPAAFVPESMRQTGIRGALDGTREEAYSGADREFASAD